MGGNILSRYYLNNGLAPVPDGARILRNAIVIVIRSREALDTFLDKTADDIPLSTWIAKGPQDQVAFFYIVDDPGFSGSHGNQDITLYGPGTVAPAPPAEGWNWIDIDDQLMGPPDLESPAKLSNEQYAKLLSILAELGVPDPREAQEEAVDIKPVHLVVVEDMDVIDPETIMKTLPGWCQEGARQIIEAVLSKITVKRVNEHLVIEGPPGSDDEYEYYIDKGINILHVILTKILSLDPTQAQNLDKIELLVASGQAVGCLDIALSKLLTKKTGEKIDSGDPIIVSGKRPEVLDAVVRWLEERYIFLTPPEKKLYCWDPTGYHYVPCEDIIRREIRELAERINAIGAFTRSVVNDIVAFIMERHYKDWPELESSRYILVTRNGWAFDVREWVTEGVLRVFRPSPEYFVRHQINARLNLEKVKMAFDHVNSGGDWLELGPKLCPTVHQAFIDWVGQENVRLLYEIVGFTLYPEYFIHKMIMLLGEGGNGKSTFAMLLRRLLGSKNVAARSLQDLAEYRFSRADLIGKLANIFPDIPKTPIKDTGVIKGLTGEDELAVDIKHRQVELKIWNYAKMIFTANKLPPVSDDTYGWWRRWIIVEFPNKFNNRDPDFLKKLTSKEELEGLLVMALLALRHLWLKGEFDYKGDAMDKWKRNVDPIYDFLKTLEQEGIQKDDTIYFAERDPDARTNADELYELYTHFINEYRGGKIMDKARFTKALEKHGIKRVLIHRKRYYKGIRLLTRGAAIEETDEEE